MVWDENDYSISPTTNKVLLTVETNYGVKGVRSKNFYTHFSLLKSIEAGFRLPSPQPCVRQQHCGDV